MEEWITAAAIALLLAFIALAFFTLSLLKKLQQHEKTLHKVHQKHKNELKSHQKERTKILHSLNDALVIVNQNELIEFANKSAQSLFKGRQLEGRTVYEAFIDHTLTGMIHDSLASGKKDQRNIVTSQHYLDNKSGSDIQVFFVETSFLPPGSNQKKSLIVLIRDVTDEHHSQQIRQDFVANASHELRTPMAIINGYLENLLEEESEVLADRQTARKFLGTMQKHGQRIATLIEDMLTIARMESTSEAPLNFDNFPLSDCLLDIRDRLDSLIVQNEANVQIDIDPPEIEIYGDRFYFTQIFFNLIENALKENTQPGLNIQVKARQSKKKILIEVSDDGIGIPSAALPYVFKRFYRVDKHHNQEKVKGTGLGLSIVLRAVEAHGGEITAESIPNQKTTFSITLPLKKDN